MRSVVEASWEGGSVAQIYVWSDIGIPSWTRFFRPLAEMIAAAHPEAEWRAIPINDATTDKTALLGY